MILQSVSYIHSDRDLLFSDIDLKINKNDKAALIGNNGVGKSTLLKILAGYLVASNGVVSSDSQPYYVPQVFGQFNDHSVTQALKIEDKIKALKDILDGHVTDENMSLLDDDWTIEERCREALEGWGLGDLDLTQKMGRLSGGQKTRVFLAGILIHRPELVLLDEPSNHLDTIGRSLLYDYIRYTKSSVLVVSHDRTLLNQVNMVYELSKNGITAYGGNYDFYAAQKRIESDALSHDVKSKEKALRKAREIERESLERQQKLDARGKKKQEKAGLPTISMNTLRNNAEKSTSRLKGVHTEKVGTISQELTQLRANLSDLDKMKMDFDNSALHIGKILVTGANINFGYGETLLWKEPLSFQITSGERIAIKGLNGSGKSTLIKMILGAVQPRLGNMDRADVRAIYIDQDYSLINKDLSVYEQAQEYNSGELQEHEIKIRLNRFLFSKAYWDKPCSALSGGEKMRLILCALTISNQAPDIMILDEPTNNLDIQSVEILTISVNEYKGTLIVVSHDEYFLKAINFERSIDVN
ncbi:ribosomal protection-like ABC-F family protein [Pedobacter nyackensis]|uniref:ATPase components of ABC transporters with duplicated ATPase domains n=1 Tax=Pedobacter nyackensis TaxID=475255 RepID=A0A1W2EM91_9SPHI|nr:ABC-F family ATP-binding cassette domain-containing protein [Pedobacter nyackensis]SMD10745.1 ATPase components of ABC transporters with duplicated ATPase domains [Pedobacter nyackensis]